MSIKGIKYFKSENIHLFGVCNFDDLKDNLLSCAAKNRLPSDPKALCHPLSYKIEELLEKYIKIRRRT